MALLTLPSVAKGTAASISLDKTELFALAAVAGDAYFSVQANVKRCIVEYSSSPGDQRKVLVFNLSEASPSASMLISSTGRDSFEIERLVLEDNDGGTLVVKRAQLPIGLDVSVSLGGSGGGGGGGSSSGDFSSLSVVGIDVEIRNNLFSTQTMAPSGSGPVAIRPMMGEMAARIYPVLASGQSLSSADQIELFVNGASYTMLPGNPASASQGYVEIETTMLGMLGTPTVLHFRLKKAGQPDLDFPLVTRTLNLV